MFQIVYIPIKSKELKNRNIFVADGMKFHYDLILKKHDRFLYKGKVRKQKKRIEMEVQDLKSINIMHAHTLFSDGGTAYLLYRKYGIKYVVSIRNTDINIFYKYAIHQRSFAHEVLKNANAIVFISPAYKKKTFELLPDNVVSQVEKNVHVIPNGIDDKWFTTDIPERKNGHLEKIQLLFTGTLDRNKNLITVLELVRKLVRTGRDVYLKVAGDGPLKDELMAYAKNMGMQKRVEFHGNVPIEHLITLVDESNIFILPSYKETFGISYIESMSRGVPVIYTRNEGIDGYFSEGSVGFSTNPEDINEMESNINKILSNYGQIAQNCIVEARGFNWKDISEKYIDIYKK